MFSWEHKAKLMTVQFSETTAVVSNALESRVTSRTSPDILNYVIRLFTRCVYVTRAISNIVVVLIIFGPSFILTLIIIVVVIIYHYYYLYYFALDAIVVVQ